MPDCAAPLWPCGLTGSAACLSGVEGVGVIIHGSAGCYFYPSTTLHSPLFCTSITDHDIILGTEEALIRTVDPLREKYPCIAVLCTCTPAITGEDIKGILDEHYGDSLRFLVINAPGFAGNYEKGFNDALSALGLPVLDHDDSSVNIDGLSIMDPFWRGNLSEIQRLLAVAGVRCRASLCGGNLTLDTSLSRYTVHANPDMQSSQGISLGSMLGMRRLEETFAFIEDRFVESGGMLSERCLPDAEERIIAACDKYLRRFDPPSVTLCGQCATMHEIGSMLATYLGAEVLGIASRNNPVKGPFRAEMVRDYEGIKEFLSEFQPDLVLGSSFEQTACSHAAFVGVTPPLRGTIRLHSRPLAGIEGALALMESVLNACIDHHRSDTTGTPN